LNAKKLVHFLFGVSLICLSGSVNAQDSDLVDPNTGVQEFLLSNGLKVILAPSDRAKTVQIKVEVLAGHFNDKMGKAGTAHLLEHYVFTDAKLDESMTYIDSIMEKGGTANAMTTNKLTVYYATVPPRLTAWIIDVFSKIFFNKKFDEKLVQRAKKPVVFEIGEPDISDFLSELREKITPKWASFPGFWESEFGVVEPSYRSSAAKVDTAGLRAKDLKAFYEEYYQPGNMVFFLSGNFDPSVVRPLLESEFGAEPQRNGVGWRDSIPYAKIAPHIRETVASGGDHSVDIGTKVTHMNLTDEISVRVYLEYLAHRLMKDLRNSKGETYTVRPIFDFRMGSGRASLEFEVPRKNFSTNYKYVKDLIDTEARSGAITQEMFEEAKLLYREHFELRDRDSGSMMSVADDWNDLDKNYPDRNPESTRFEAYKSLDYSSFVQSLKKTFSKGMEFEEVRRPAYLFGLEIFVLVILASAGWLALGRRIFAQSFDHSKVRWVRKLTFPPIYVLQTFITLEAFLLSTTVWAATSRLLASTWVVSAPAWISEYCMILIAAGESILTILTVLGLSSRKVMIVGDRFVVKSLSYRSYSFRLSEIESVELKGPSILWKSPRLLLRSVFFFEYADPFLRKGILIRLKDGRRYFLGIRNSKEAIQQLQSELTARQGHPIQAVTDVNMIRDLAA
jgi:predicted Zn-dependent peptidase